MWEVEKRSREVVVGRERERERKREEVVEKRATTGGGEQRVHWRPLTDSTQPQQLDWGGREARG